MGEDLEARGHRRAHRAVTQRIGRIVQPSGAQTRKLARTCEKRTLHFIGVVKHRTSILPSSAKGVATGVTGCKANCCAAARKWG